MFLKQLQVGHMAIFAYIVGDKETGDALVIDPAAETERIVAEEVGVNVAAAVVLQLDLLFVEARGWPRSSRLAGRLGPAIGLEMAGLQAPVAGPRLITRSASLAVLATVLAPCRRPSCRLVALDSGSSGR